MDSGLDIYDLQADRHTGDPDGMTATEAGLVRLWADVLERDSVGLDDNFFLLGGDSLRAVTLYAEVEAAFGVALPLEAVFDEGETVAGMAALIDRARHVPPDAARHPETGTANTAPAPDSATAPHPPPPDSLFARGDLTIALTLLVLAVAAWLPRRTVLPAFCRLLATLHVAVRGTRSGHLASVVDLLDSNVTPGEIEIGVLAGGYEEIAGTLRQYGPRPPRPAVRLHGRDHIDAALAAGRGAVLWNFAGVPGSRVATQCLKEAGIPLVQLRSTVHPLSGSTFGIRVLNPILNRIDDRNLRAWVPVHDAGAVEAMQALGTHLHHNEAVRMSAHGSGDAPHEIPFLGGTLRLALGAPTLALLHDAPLIPVFSIPDGSGGFDVVVEAPLTAGDRATSRDGARDLAERYAAILARYVKRHPRLWRGWFMRNTWRAGAGGNHDDA